MAIFEGFTDDAFTWGNLIRAVQSGSAAAWFDQYPSVSGKAMLDKLVEPQFAFLRESAPFLDEWRVCEPFGANCANAAAWQSYEATLDARQLSGYRYTDAMISILDELEVPYFELSSGDEIVVIFELENGLHASSIRLYQAASGPVAEVANVMLAADLDMSDAGPDFLLSRFVAVPAVLQGAAYLAETPFPSSTWMMQGTRELTFPEIPVGHRPQPFFDCVGNDPVRIPWLDADRELTFEFPLVETGIRFGYKIRLDLSAQELTVIFDRVLTALPKMNTILDDGFLNAGVDSAAPFQSVLASRVAFSDGEGYAYRPYLEVVREFTPGPRQRYSAQLDASTRSVTVPDSSAKRFCESCGAPRNPDARFCGSCGAPLQ